MTLPEAKDAHALRLPKGTLWTGKNTHSRRLTLPLEVNWDCGQNTSGPKGTREGPFGDSPPVCLRSMDHMATPQLVLGPWTIWRLPS